MVVTPAMRGLLGIEVKAGGKELRFAPQLPANWNQAEARQVAAGTDRLDLKLERGTGSLTVKITRRVKATPNGAKGNAGVARITVAPAFPLDARVRSVRVQGKAIKFAPTTIGDIQRAEVTVDASPENIEVVYIYDEGTDVFADQEIPAPGAPSRGLRILRSHAEQGALHLVLEGIGGRSYVLGVRTPHQIGDVSGARVETGASSATQVRIAFDGPTDTYVRREFTLPLRRKEK